MRTTQLKRQNPYSHLPRGSQVKRPKPDPLYARMKARSMSNPIVRAQYIPKANPRALRNNELKSMDMDFTVQPYHSISTGATIGRSFTLINNLASGSGLYQRDGAKVAGMSLEYDILLQPACEGFTVGDFWPDGRAWPTHQYRMAIVWDKSPNGAFPALNDVFMDYLYDGTTTTTVQAGPNPITKERFTILRDFKIQVSQGVYEDKGNGVHVFTYGTAADGISKETIINNCHTTHVNGYIKLKGLETHFKSSTGIQNIADISYGSLYLVTYSNLIVQDGVATVLPYQIYANTRFSYKDI